MVGFLLSYSFMFDFKLFSLSWRIPFGLCEVIFHISQILLKKDVKMNEMGAFMA